MSIGFFNFFYLAKNYQFNGLAGIGSKPIGAVGFAWLPDPGVF